MSEGSKNSNICPKCYATRPARANFCPRCGSPFMDTGFRSTTRTTPLLERWRQLHYALTRKEIRKLLGEPKRVEPPAETSNDTCERWIYEYEAITQSERKVSGELRISVAESRLVSWTEPNWDEM